jgi:hypothetical protein
MIVRETKDEKEIKSILLHEDIKKHIGGKDMQDFKMPDDCYYLGGYEDDKIFAVSCFHKFKDGLKFHPNILKSHRLKYGREFVSLCLTMVKCKMYIEIPKARKELFNFSKKNGFDSIRNNKDSLTHLMVKLWAL